VEQISWNEAEAYCRAISGRLPTEEEWEYSARAGSQQRWYGDPDAIAWYLGNSGNQTHEVGKKLANGWGLFDTLGNVKEWTSGGYEPHLLPERGGEFSSDLRFLRVSYRQDELPIARGSWTGFRCAAEFP
jgi:sulfatase modifying factor 1